MPLTTRYTRPVRSLLYAPDDAMYPTQVAVDEPAKQVTLSKILLWYGADFAPAGDTQALLRVVRGYLPAASEVGTALDAVLAAPAGDVTVAFRDYDWARNDA